MVHSNVPIDKYFPVTKCSRAHIGTTSDTIKKKLTQKQMTMFRKTCFGPLLDVNIVFNGQLIHHFLFREIRDDDKDVISFNILGKKVTFTLENFNLITRLWPIEERIERDTNKEGL